MLVKIILGFLQSLLLFIKHKPKIVVGFGGYTSIPSILAAKILKIKILIHEQNAVMGKTNRLLSYLTKNIALTFKNTKYAKNCSIHTGIPVRPKKKANSKSKLKRIFVVGGSQGAKIFSKLVPKLIENLSSRSKKKLIVVQQVRKEDMELTINSNSINKLELGLTYLSELGISIPEEELVACIDFVRKLRENYRVSGKDGKLDRALPKNAFPRLIIEYIEQNLKKHTPKKRSGWFKRLINK